MHLAVIWGDNPKIVNALMVAGADVSAKDLDGDTPLDLAIRVKHKEVAQILRDANTAWENK